MRIIMAEEIKKNEQEVNEISDNELEGVSGGGWWKSNPHYSSGNKPLYSVGDKCVVSNGSSLRTVIVVEVSKEKSGLINKEFKYTVKNVSDGEIEKDVYESQIKVRY